MITLKLSITQKPFLGHFYFPSTQLPFIGRSPKVHLSKVKGQIQLATILSIDHSQKAIVKWPKFKGRGPKAIVQILWAKDHSLKDVVKRP